MMIRDEAEFNKAPPAGYDGRFEWDVFQENGCFKEVPKIQPMDFDGVVERHRHYLVFETKKDGAGIPPGQQITLDNLKISKTFTVIKIWPKIPPFKKAQIVTAGGGKYTIEGHDNIIGAVRKWFIKANSNEIEIYGECDICGIFTKTKRLCENCYGANKGGWG